MSSSIEPSGSDESDASNLTDSSVDIAVSGDTVDDAASDSLSPLP
ncbi:hypothetical protein [Halomicrobium urmianum]|nr:hypothetical protein [Halomicrobium urmianum]